LERQKRKGSDITITFDPVNKILGKKINVDLNSRNKNNEEVEVSHIPKCDICGEVDAQYDGKTTSGPWANMCGSCFSHHGVGVGLGKGQRLILRK